MKKKCTQCSQVKPLDCFCKKKAAKDGLQSQCKDCNKEILKKWRKDNPNYYDHYYKLKVGYYE